MYRPILISFKGNPHRASASASVVAAVSDLVSLKYIVMLGSGTDFQASQCISMRSNLTLSLTLGVVIP